MVGNQSIAEDDEGLVSLAEKCSRQWIEEGNGSLCNLNQPKRPTRPMKKRKQDDAGLIRPGRRPWLNVWLRGRKPAVNPGSLDETDGENPFYR